VVQRNRKNSELNNWSEHENEYGDLINNWTETDTIITVQPTSRVDGDYIP